MTSNNVVKTPCIGVCSTGIGDSVCRGCKRFLHEVIGWNSYSEPERRAIMLRLDDFLDRLVRARVEIFDPERLLHQLQHQQLRFNADASPGCWVFDLLKAGASQIHNLEAFGCRPLPEWQALSMAELRDAIDSDFYTLSCAHYERYFQINT